ncbi:MAG: Tm-1-like ATP-binding domain-containing protein [Rubripirellula sp.]|nr:Tm-1-like ATP-binding domain-containing protein [Rubripirellula sp.]
MNNAPEKVVYAIATMDTKAEENIFVADCLRNAGIEVQTVDVGTDTPPITAPDVTRETVLGEHTLPENAGRSEAISEMSRSLVDFLTKQNENEAIAGVIGIGGSGGTALITAAMRSLPVGLPKLIVSTVASGNTAAYVDCTDITMMHSVVDVAGLNGVSRAVLSNAAHAMAGMVRHRLPTEYRTKSLGMTMFGVTTPCVTAVRESLERKGFECFVFHATGVGGRAMEGLVRSGLIQGVLDITTTEVADEVVGGLFPAGPSRFDATVNMQIPLVLSVGAVDMVNFGGLETVPSKFRDRNLHVHNDQITLMRTTADENVAIAKWIAKKLNRSSAPLRVVLPEGGVSMLDAPDAAFYDPDADSALFETLESEINVSKDRHVIRSPHHINAPEFSQLLVEQFETIGGHVDL